jgi:Fe-coproporphyrin III synthase
MPKVREYLHYLTKINRAPQFESLFLFVTSRCNSVCRTCFYWDNLNLNQDLTFEQLETISRTAPPFRKLWLSGGEPFLRPELAEIITMFARNNGVRHVNLPTNGLLAGKTDAVIGQVLEQNPEVTIDLNFSLDGLANTHDTIRGVPKNFQRTLQTLTLMERKYRGLRRLRRNVVSVVTAENYRELVDLGLRLLDDARASGHYFEIIRGNPLDPELKRIPREDLRELHNKLLWVHQQYADRLFEGLPALIRWFGKMYYLGNLKLHFDIHEECHYEPRRWPMRCTAGQTSVVIDHNGEFRSCEMRPAVGRVQDHGFNLAGVLGSPEMRREVAAIPEANCWCTHSCFIHDSAKFSPRVMLFSLPWRYLKTQIGRLPQSGVDELRKYHVRLPV